MAESAVLGDFSYLSVESEANLLAPKVGALRPAERAERWQMLKPLVANRGYPPLLFEATLNGRMVLHPRRRQE